MRDKIRQDPDQHQVVIVAAALPRRHHAAGECLGAHHRIGTKLRDQTLQLLELPRFKSSRIRRVRTLNSGLSYMYSQISGAVLNIAKYAFSVTLDNTGFAWLNESSSIVSIGGSSRCNACSIATAAE